MLNRVQRIGLAALLILGIGLGGVWGLRSVPPGETAIIEAAAAAYVAETGGVATDCAARPSALPEVHLVVICAEGAWVAAYDTFGRPVALDPQQLQEEPLT
jgi:hypothetical protein